MSTFKLCKKVIENQKKQGTLDVEEMTMKLDIFLIGDRITEEEYKELIQLMV